jgi:hypothetical protein
MVNLNRLRNRKLLPLLFIACLLGGITVAYAQMYWSSTVTMTIVISGNMVGGQFLDYSLAGYKAKTAATTVHDGGLGSFSFTSCNLAALHMNVTVVSGLPAGVTLAFQGQYFALDASLNFVAVGAPFALSGPTAIDPTKLVYANAVGGAGLSVLVTESGTSAAGTYPVVLKIQVTE